MSVELKFKAFTKKKRGYIPSIQWDDYKEFILRKAAEKIPYKDIVEALKLEKGVDMKVRQLKDKIKEWGVGRQNLNPRQRTYIRTVHRRRRDEGKPATNFRFKTNGRVIPETQIEAALKESGTDTPGDTKNDCKTPGLVYFTPTPVDDDSADLLVEGHDHTNENREVDTGDKDPSTLWGATWANTIEDPTQPGDEPVGETETGQSGIGEEEDNPDAVQTICEEVLNSVQGVYMATETAVPDDARRKTIPRVEKNYSIRFAADLDEWIMEERQIASTFWWMMMEARVRSGWTLSLEMCYAHAQKDCLGHDFLDPLPLQIYLELDDSGAGIQTKRLTPQQNILWEGLRVFYAQHLDEVATYCLNGYPLVSYSDPPTACYPRRGNPSVKFKQLAAHFITLSDRFGSGHFFPLSAIICFAEILVEEMDRTLPLQTLYGIYKILEDRGMRNNRQTIKVLQYIAVSISSEVTAGDFTNLRHFLTASQLAYHISTTRPEIQDIEYMLDPWKFQTLAMLIRAHLLNGQRNEAIAVISFARKKMAMARHPNSLEEWRAYATNYYLLGATTVCPSLSRLRKKFFESAYKASRQIQAMSPSDDTATEITVRCLSRIGSIDFSMGKISLAIEKEKAQLDFLRESHGVYDKAYLKSIRRITIYMSKRGLVRYSQPILRLTIETCEVIGIKGKYYYELMQDYYGDSFTLDMAAFSETHGPSWEDMMW
ncbi:hypothetical protein TWF718_007426 [Orbilia javanica]|uniref:Clr5 domain-containing protein n=1 Tax=Orbilia javanica TaxID=47235 RepID=A0AAN8N0I2_9PEZI